MGKSAGKAEALSSLGPVQFQEPYVKELLSEAQRIYRQHTPQFFPGGTVADMPHIGTWGQRMIDYMANTFSDNVSPEIIRSVTRGLNPEQNPYVDQIADVIQKRINRNLTEQILPSIQSGAVATGTLGGSRQALAQGLATRDTQETLADALTQLYGNEFNRQNQTMLQTLQLMPSAYQAAISPAMSQVAIGEQQRALEQERINEQVARWSFEQQLPYQRLAEYFNVASRPFGSTGYQVTGGGGGGAAGTIGAIIGGIGTLLPFLPGWFR